VPASIETRYAPRWRRYGLITAIAAGLVIAAYYYFQDDGGQPASASTSTARSASTVFGPGALSAPAANMSLSAQAPETPAIRIAPPGGLAVTGNQQLLVNTALLNVINFFLLEQPDADRAAGLQAYLQSKLPAAAYGQAMQIVGNYQRYMTAHDDLLSAQNLEGTSQITSLRNVERINIWREQRDRLRLSMLGADVVQAWYQADDTQLQQVLAELQQRASQTNGDTDDSALAGPEAPGGNEHTIKNEVQHVLITATKSYASLAREGRQWTTRYSTYLNAADKINRQSGLSPFERNRQIQALLVTSFPAEAERQRARDQAPLTSAY
jgi:lipase chaperone LimK